MRRFIGGLIGGIVGSLLSLMWFILGGMFVYSIDLLGYRSKGAKLERVK